jgi:hypothetical protein
MDEQRKYAILFVATILAARTIAHHDYKPCPAVEAAIANAISMAEHILERIDRRFP